MFIKSKEWILNPFANIEDEIDTIYHYTSPAGLKGIIESKYFYFTHYEFLNDIQERTNIDEIYKEFINEYEEKYDKDFLEVISNIHNDNNTSSYSYYVFSCSSNPDNLSLWKYYTKNDKYQGYAISFHPATLWFNAHEHFSKYNIRFRMFSGSVYYKKTKKIELIKEAIDKLYTLWNEDKNRANIGFQYIEWLSVMSLFYKHIGYKEEEEYRIVLIVTKENEISKLINNNELFLMRDKDGLFIPTLKIRYAEKVQEGFYGLFEEIIFGPTIKEELTYKGLKVLLQSNGFDLNEVTISSSKIPLRY